MLIRALILGICFSFSGGMIYDVSTVYASNNGTEGVEQNRKKKKKSTKKKTVTKKTGLSSFGQAYRDARKKGLKTFKHGGKTYTTVKDTDNKKNITSNKKKNTNESASYKNVSFGSAYKDAKKKGLSTFTWNGKKYTTGKSVTTNTKNKKKSNVTKKNTKSKKKYTKKKSTKKKNYTKKKTRKKSTTNRTYNRNNNNSSKNTTYTPPPSYDTGRDFKRDNSSNNNTPVKKEPKKE